MNILIDNAANIQFMAQLIRGDENQMFGRLQITLYCGTVIDVNDFLINLSVGLKVESSDIFLRKLISLDSIRKQRYQTNQNMVQSADLNFAGNISLNVEIVPDLFSHQVVRDDIFDWFRRNASLHVDDESGEPAHWMSSADAEIALAYPTKFKLNYSNTVSDIVTVLPTYFNLSYVNPPLPAWYMANLKARMDKGLQILGSVKTWVKKTDDEEIDTQSDPGASTSQNVLTEKKPKRNRPKSPIHLVGYDSN